MRSISSRRSGMSDHPSAVRPSGNWLNGPRCSGLVEGPAPGVVLAIGVTQQAAVFSAGAAEMTEGDGVAAGLGEAAPAVSVGVRPFAVPLVTCRWRQRLPKVISF